MHTILLVDDNPRFLKGFAQTFGTLARRSARTPGSIRLLTSDNAAQAMAILADSPIELLLVNIDSMDSPPPEFIARVLATIPGLPIFVLSMKGNDDRFDACLEAGADRVFDHPITRSEIIPVFGAIITKLERPQSGGSRLFASASAPPPSFLARALVVSDSNLLVDSVGGNDSVLYQDLLAYLDRRSQVVAQKLGLSAEGAFEFVGSGSLAVATFGDRIQSFGVTTDKGRTAADVVSALQSLTFA